jgi:hypothetical protein
MNECFIVDSMSFRLNITNPKILSFYKSNLHIDFENINLILIDLLTSTSNIQVSPTIENVKSTILSPEEQKIKELETFLTKIREANRKLIQSVSNKYIILIASKTFFNLSINYKMDSNH